MKDKNKLMKEIKDLLNEYSTLGNFLNFINGIIYGFFIYSFTIGLFCNSSNHLLISIILFIFSLLCVLLTSKIIKNILKEILNLIEKLKGGINKKENGKK